MAEADNSEGILVGEGHLKMGNEQPIFSSVNRCGSAMIGAPVFKWENFFAILETSWSSSQECYEMDFGTDLEVTPETVLLTQVQAKDSTSFMILFNRYRPLICKLWYQFRLTNTSLDDWLQEAALVLYRVACAYSNQQAQFCWYLKQALTNRIRDLYRQQAAKKRVPACCLEPLTDAHVEVIAIDHHLGPDEVAQYRRTYYRFKDNCSQLEWETFVKINQGFEIGEVACKLGCKRQCVRSALERARKKFVQELT